MVKRLKSTILNEGDDSIRVDYFKSDVGSSGYQQSRPGYVTIALVGKDADYIDRVAGFITGFKYPSKEHIEKYIVPKVRKAIISVNNGFFTFANNSTGWEETKDIRSINGNKNKYHISYSTNRKIKHQSFPNDLLHYSNISIFPQMTYKQLLENEKTGKEIYDVHQVDIGNYKKDGMYHTDEYSRSFKTKQEAIDYAKEHMRSHPNG